MKSRVANAWQQLRASFWFVPALMALAAALLSFATLTFDANPGRLSRNTVWFWSGEPQGARDMLTTIAGSMITVAGIAFSVTIVALTLTANQFGPRLLRNFTRDSGNQVVLGTFIATFLYCLLVLRMVRDFDGAGFVPHLSVTVAVGLAIASIGILIYFIHHISVMLQVENVAYATAHELTETIEGLFPEKLGTSPDIAGQDGFTVPEADTDDLMVSNAAQSGYLQAIENENLLTLAEENDLVFCIHTMPGEFVRVGTALVTAWPDSRCSEKVVEAIAGMFVIGHHRTPTQDVRYPMQQLVAIAVRALSPGINDPFTAVTCIDWIGDGLGRLAERKIPSRFRLGRRGVLRVIASPVTFSELSDVAFNQIRQAGAGHIVVMLRLLESIEMISGRAGRPEDRDALLRHAELIARQARSAGHQPSDLAMVEAFYNQVEPTLRGHGDGVDSEPHPSEQA